LVPSSEIYGVYDVQFNWSPFSFNETLVVIHVSISFKNISYAQFVSHVTKLAALELKTTKFPSSDMPSALVSSSDCIPAELVETIVTVHEPMSLNTASEVDVVSPTTLFRP
jgi:hypothetical protein